MMKGQEGAELWVRGKKRKIKSFFLSVIGKQRAAGLGDISIKIRHFKKVLTAKGELKTETEDPLAHYSGDMSKTSRSPPSKDIVTNCCF